MSSYSVEYYRANKDKFMKALRTYRANTRLRARRNCKEILNEYLIKLQKIRNRKE